MDKPPSALHEFFLRDGRMHPAWRALLYLATCLFCLFFVQVPLVLAWATTLMLRGNTLPAAITRIETDALSLVWMVPLAVVQALTIVGATYLFRRLLDRRSFKSLGLETTPGWVQEVMLGLLLGFGVMGGIFLVEWLTGWASITVSTASFPTVAARLMGYGVVYVGVALVEELIFRGYLLQTLREWPGTFAATMITSLLFGLGHACNPNVSALALLFLVTAGFVFAYAYLETGRLWLPIALHFSWNFFQGAVFGFPVSGMTSQGVFTIEPSGPVLLTGGSFGPEAGLTGLAAMVVIVVAVKLRSQSTSRGERGHELAAD